MRKQLLSNLAVEAENAIMLLPTQEQDYIRYQVVYNLQTQYRQQKKQHTNPNLKNTHENWIINQIKTKLNNERAMITKADKGRTLVILYINDYNKKVNNFISNNNFHQTANDITNRFYNKTSEAQ
jgi:hypothetical protein